jgi:hypothetical protein
MKGGRVSVIAISSHQINQRALIMLYFETLVNDLFLDAIIASVFPAGIVEHVLGLFNLIDYGNIEYKRQMGVAY